MRRPENRRVPVLPWTDGPSHMRRRYRLDEFNAIQARGGATIPIGVVDVASNAGLLNAVYG